MTAKTTTTKTTTSAKGAAKKGAKPAATPANAAPVVAAVEVETFAQKLAKNIATRNHSVPSKDLDHARSIVLKGQSSINALYANPHFAGVLDQLASDALTSDKGKPAFIGVKPLVKIAHAMIALASGVRGEFDPYSRTIVANLAKLSGVTNKSALVCLSKSVTYDAIDQQQALSVTYNCNASTATTQASSSRMMLRALGLCAVEKGKRGDVTRTLENERCAMLLRMFATE